MSDDVRDLLHKVWLAVHLRRFDESTPNSNYRGVQLAEQAIEEVAERHDVSWHQLRRGDECSEGER